MTRRKPNSPKPKSAILSRLRRQRNTAQRLIAKINGKRELIEHFLIEGETWWASSHDWRLPQHLERVKAREEWNSLTEDERNHRTLLAHGWRLVNNQVN